MTEVDEITKTLLYRRIELLESEVAREKTAAETDNLTRLGNRLMLERRATARGGWFVLCDLDGFKKAQDQHPAKHAYGDLILIEFADYLRTIVRSDPGRAMDFIAARTGGDEFVVRVPSRKVAQRVKLMVRCWTSADGKVSASVGMGPDMKSADGAMYLDKRAKKRRALAETLLVAHLADGIVSVLKTIGLRVE